MATDFDMFQHGTIAQISPNTLEAEAWLRDNLETEPWQAFGHTICIEPRCLPEIMAGITADGLTQTLDGRECEVWPN